MQRAIMASHSHKYVSEFTQWVWKFIAKEALFEESRDVVLLCSGGADSLALFHVLTLRSDKLQQKLKIVYFHHGTRNSSEHESEIELIQRQIEKVKSREKVWRDKIEFHVLSLSGLSLGQSDFENRARFMRYQTLASYFNPRTHYFLTGHHIDDSFEWWLRGRLTQSHPQKPWGIPLKNGSYRRPFHCVTKDQILKFMKLGNFSYAEDSSNNDQKFERNYLRKTIINRIKKRYPKFLRHYVNQRMGEIASAKRKNSRSISVLSLAANLHYFSFRSDLDDIEDLEKILLKYSHAEQGMLRKSLRHTFGNKRDSMFKTSGLKGPLSLSGDLHLWQWHHHYFLSISKNRPSKNLETLDQVLVTWLHKHNLHLRTSDHKTIEAEFHQVTKLFESLGISIRLKENKFHGHKKKIGFLHQLCPNFCQKVEDLGFVIQLKGQ